MAIDWDNFATAVTCNLEWERLCGRGAFLGELSLHRTIAEYIQSATALKIKTEYNHQDIPGNSRLDVVGFGPQGNTIQLAIEAKWVKSDGGIRYWHKETAEDIFRLEMLHHEISQTIDRCIVIAGVTAKVQKELINKKKRVGMGLPLVPWIDAILPTSQANTSRKIEVRAAKKTYREFFKERATEIGVSSLPVSYQAQLVGHYQIDNSDKDSIETYVWRINRSKNRKTFTYDP